MEQKKIGGLARELNVSQSVVERAIAGDEEFGLPPIEGKEYKDRGGHFIMHYPLSQVQERLQDFLSTELAPEGWYTISGLADELDIHPATVKKAIAGNEELGLLPLEAREYKTTTGRKLPHYSLAEVKERLQDFLSTESAPEGWYTIGGLADELGLSVGTIKRAIAGDEEFGLLPLIEINCKTTQNKSLPHYSLIEISKRVEHLLSTESAPEGWYTARGLSKN